LQNLKQNFKLRRAIFFFIIFFIEICIFREYLSEKIMLSEILGKLEIESMRYLTKNNFKKIFHFFYSAFYENF